MNTIVLPHDRYDAPPGPRMHAHGALHVGRITADDISKVIVRANRIWLERDSRGRDVLCFSHHNAYVRSGLRNLELLQAGAGGTTIKYLFLDNDSSAVTVNTRFAHGASAGGATSSTPTSTQLFCAATATVVTDGSGVVQSTVYQGPTLTATNFSAGVFIINKVGCALAAADADGNLVDVVGGTSGAAPYDRSFSINLTAATGFTYTPAMQTYSIADPTQ